MPVQRATQHSIETSNLADLLERILDKGLVIAGDIKIKLVDIELLTIQIRLMICSVEKAREMGMDWWTNNAAFCPAPAKAISEDSLARIEQRLARMEEQMSLEPAVPVAHKI